jgi:phosphoribosyl-ATP pyrophosphohydrolase
VSLQVLETLQGVIRERLAAPSAQSYTSRMAAAGPVKVAQKLGEEGIELALAAVAEDDARVKEEAADLVYHLLLLLALRGLAFTDVVATLEKRHIERR